MRLTIFRSGGIYDYSITSITTIEKTKLTKWP